MQAISSEPAEDSDLVQTLPVSERPSGAPVSTEGSWDSEAPTAVHARRPPFAGPPRLPNT
jgi:hypothetical protein